MLNAAFAASKTSRAASTAATLSLALLSGAYPLARDLTTALAEPPLILSMGATVVELGQLATLLEAAAFAPLRLRLLRPSQYPALLQALHSVLMLLPQGDAFKLLQQRLLCVPAGAVWWEAGTGGANGAVAAAAATGTPGDSGLLGPTPQLVERFISVQSRRTIKPK